MNDQLLTTNKKNQRNCEGLSYLYEEDEGYGDVQISERRMISSDDDEEEEEQEQQYQSRGMEQQYARYQSQISQQLERQLDEEQETIEQKSSNRKTLLSQNLQNMQNNSGQRDFQQYSEISRETSTIPNHFETEQKNSKQRSPQMKIPLELVTDDMELVENQLMQNLEFSPIQKMEESKADMTSNMFDFSMVSGNRERGNSNIIHFQQQKQQSLSQQQRNLFNNKQKFDTSKIKEKNSQQIGKQDPKSQKLRERFEKYSSQMIENIQKVSKTECQQRQLNTKNTLIGQDQRLNSKINLSTNKIVIKSSSSQIKTNHELNSIEHQLDMRFQQIETSLSNQQLNIQKNPSIFSMQSENPNNYQEAENKIPLRDHVRQNSLTNYTKPTVSSQKKIQSAKTERQSSAKSKQSNSSNQVQKHSQKLSLNQQPQIPNGQNKYLLFSPAHTPNLISGSLRNKSPCHVPQTLITQSEVQISHPIEQDNLRKEIENKSEFYHQNDQKVQVHQRSQSTNLKSSSSQQIVIQKQSSHKNFGFAEDGSPLRKERNMINQQSINTFQDENELFNDKKFLKDKRQREFLIEESEKVEINIYKSKSTHFKNKSNHQDDLGQMNKYDPKIKSLHHQQEIDNKEKMSQNKLQSSRKNLHSPSSSVDITENQSQLKNTHEQMNKHALNKSSNKSEHSEFYSPKEKVDEQFRFDSSMKMSVNSQQRESSCKNNNVISNHNLSFSNIQVEEENFKIASENNKSCRSKQNSVTCREIQIEKDLQQERDLSKDCKVAQTCQSARGPEKQWGQTKKELAIAVRGNSSYQERHTPKQVSSSSLKKENNNHNGVQSPQKILANPICLYKEASSKKSINTPRQQNLQSWQQQPYFIAKEIKGRKGDQYKDEQNSFSPSKSQTTNQTKQSLSQHQQRQSTFSKSSISQFSQNTPNNSNTSKLLDQQQQSQKINNKQQQQQQQQQIQPQPLNPSQKYSINLPTEQQSISSGIQTINQTLISQINALNQYQQQFQQRQAGKCLSQRELFRQQQKDKSLRRSNGHKNNQEQQDSSILRKGSNGNFRGSTKDEEDSFQRVIQLSKFVPQRDLSSSKNGVGAINSMLDNNNAVNFNISPSKRNIQGQGNFYVSVNKELSQKNIYLSKQQSLESYQLATGSGDLQTLQDFFRCNTDIHQKSTKAQVKDASQVLLSSNKTDKAYSNLPFQQPCIITNALTPSGSLKPSTTPSSNWRKSPMQSDVSPTRNLEKHSFMRDNKIFGYNKNTVREQSIDHSRSEFQEEKQVQQIQKVLNKCFSPTTPQYQQHFNLFFRYLINQYLSRKQTSSSLNNKSKDSTTITSTTITSKQHKQLSSRNNEFNEENILKHLREVKSQQNPATKFSFNKRINNYKQLMSQNSAMQKTYEHLKDQMKLYNSYIQENKNCKAKIPESALSDKERDELNLKIQQAELEIQKINQIKNRYAIENRQLQNQNKQLRQDQMKIQQQQSITRE